jgi:tRNA pseudouridine38-40 synthase
LQQPAAGSSGSGLFHLDPMTRIRLDVAYDGREFAGWARQRELRTVQGVLEEMIANLVGAEVEITCAGRTDAGVHARGQVAHIDVSNWPADLDTWRINRALPDDIRVLAIRVVPNEFDARFSALWRRYTYRVSDSPIGPAPLARGQVLQWGKALDLELMNSASGLLIGEHDFTAYCKMREGASAVRELLELNSERVGSDIVITVTADAFCHSMVRSLIGALLPVGDGRKPVTWPFEMLTSGIRGATVMPPFPLVLEEVGYPPDGQLLDRQMQTKQRRTLSEPEA